MAALATLRDVWAENRRVDLAFHITPARNVASILRDGLMPRRGRRARDAREADAGIWCFVDRAALEYGVMNWLDGMFSDRTQLAVLSVDVSGESVERNGIEMRLARWISPRRIVVITYDLG